MSVTLDKTLVWKGQVPYNKFRPTGEMLPFIIENKSIQNTSDFKRESTFIR